MPGKLDWVLHFASPASPPKYLDNPIETLRINSEGTYNLLTTACLKNAQLLFASTSEIYGDPLVHPQSETYWGHVNPIGPRSVYDEAKRFGEAIVYACRRSWGLPVRVIRIFNTYGPFMDPDDGRVVSNMICLALKGLPLTVYGNGKQTRSFLSSWMDLVEGDRPTDGCGLSGTRESGKPARGFSAGTRPDGERFDGLQFGNCISPAPPG